MKYNLSNEIAKRQTKSVYRDDDKTIKLFIENYSKANILNEALIQARVEEGTNLNIPKLIEVSKIDNRWALVSEHIEGTPLDVIMEQNPEKEDEYLKMFVDLQLSVLSNTVPLLNRIKDKFRRKLTEAKNIHDNVRYELLQRLEGMKNHTKLCHGDFNPSNVVVSSNGKCHIIDWAHVTIGNASADAANTYMNFVLEGKEELANKYLNLFSEKSKIEKINIQRWIPIVAASRKQKGIQKNNKYFLIG